MVAAGGRQEAHLRLHKRDVVIFSGSRDVVVHQHCGEAKGSESTQHDSAFTVQHAHHL